MSSVQGLLTPFDRLEGFERRVHEPEANGETSASGTKWSLMYAYNALRDPSIPVLGCHPMHGVKLMNTGTKLFLWSCLCVMTGLCAIAFRWQHWGTLRDCA